MTDLPASGIERRPVYQRYLEIKHHMKDPSEPPTVAEISDAQALLDSSYDDDLRDCALDILRLAGLDDDD